MNGYYSQVIDVLRANHYRFDRPGKGSHEIWTNGKRSQTVPHNMPSRHTANEIMKQCGLSHRFR